jgi:hypothetical protein
MNFWDRNQFFFNFLITKSSNLISNLNENCSQLSFEVYNVCVAQKLQISEFWSNFFFAWTLATSATSRGRNFNLSNFYHTEIEIWAGFGQVGSTVRVKMFLQKGFETIVFIPITIHCSDSQYNLREWFSTKFSFHINMWAEQVACANRWTGHIYIWDEFVLFCPFHPKSYVTLRTLHSCIKLWVILLPELIKIGFVWKNS